ncbi:Protein MCM10 [Portunus trituberculatus]|uniref:Protein MCM10 n=1 Tax=Portunus trituberculatus TaxID=210409 RepID=A0A5B7II87_PORTR|nr:Protein MCM10 [Portunus trituberculatus]
MISLSVFEPQRVMIMGMSKDLGWCKGKTKMNEPCRCFVNKSSCEFCVYHIQREYQKTASKRAVIQSSFTRVDPKRRLQERVLGKDQVSAGQESALLSFPPSFSLATFPLCLQSKSK